MPQIAQQDYLKIQIEDLSNVTDAEKAIIREKVSQGIIFDCIIVSGELVAKVVSLFDNLISIAVEDSLAVIAFES